MIFSDDFIYFSWDQRSSKLPIEGHNLKFGLKMEHLKYKYKLVDSALEK